MSAIARGIKVSMLKIVVVVAIIVVAVTHVQALLRLPSSSIRSSPLLKKAFRLNSCCGGGGGSGKESCPVPAGPTKECTTKTGVKGKSYMNCRFTGIGSCTGSVVMSNLDFEKLIDTNDAWISKRTGIKTRKYLEDGASLRAASATAAKEALKMANVDAKDIDLVLVATSSPEDLFGDAPSIAAEIGATNAAAFDITAACSGFVVASLTAAQFIENNMYNRVLIIGADALSRYLDWNDRGSCILFGDGAGAVVMENSGVRCGTELSSGSSRADEKCCGQGCSEHDVKMSETGTKDPQGRHHHGLLGFAMHSDGVRGKHLSLPFMHNYSEVGLPGTIKVNKGVYGKVTMNGAEVYKFAVNEVPAVVFESLRNAGMNASEIDWLVLHQANTRIIDHVAHELGLPKEKVR
jgi:3-oxoacyl-[acyl-carrier-protein] synthase-3